MSLRDEIANEIESWGYNIRQYSAADAILALPSGLVAVRECNKCVGDGIYRWAGLSSPCDCKGTGRIVRELTVAEALEWAAEWAKPDAIREYYYSQDDGKIYIFWRGERIMRKEDA